MVGATVSSLSILWNPSTDNVSVAGYKVYVNGAIQDSIITNTYIIIGLEEGTSYSVSVSAFDEANNESDRSPPVVGQTEISTDTTAPTIPNGLNATDITNTTILLTWNPSSDNIAVAGYGVFLNGFRIDETTITAYTFSGLSPTTLYTLSVSAFMSLEMKAFPPTTPGKHKRFNPTEYSSLTRAFNSSTLPGQWPC